MSEERGVRVKEPDVVAMLATAATVLVSIGRCAAICHKAFIYSPRRKRPEN